MIILMMILYYTSVTIQAQVDFFTNTSLRVRASDRAREEGRERERERGRERENLTDLLIHDVAKHGARYKLRS